MSGRAAKATSAGPLADWVVLLISERFWTSSATPGQLRALGARTVRKPCAGMTHVGLPFEPTSGSDAAIAQLFLSAGARDQLETAKAYVAARRLPVRFVGPEALQVAVRTAQADALAREKARREAEDARIAARLASAPTPGFIGV